MTVIDELLNEHSLHSVRSDGSQMIVLKTGQTESGPEWEIISVRKDGQVENDGTLLLASNEKAVLRKTYNNSQLQEVAARQDFVEWKSGVHEEEPNEQVLILQNRLQHTEDELKTVKAQYETTNKQLQEAQKHIQELTNLNVSQRRKERATSRMKLEEIEQRFTATAAAIAERTPSETQKIIADQVALGGGFYEEVGVQSHESFRLSLWLAAAGGVIFFVTAVAIVLVTLLHGNTTLITIIGSVAAAITEGLAASNRLYNQASQQFANFQVDLDRINRSSIGYAMITEEAFERKTPTQQEEIVKIIGTLLSSS